jgi:hypothetical protein
LITRRLNFNGKRKPIIQETKTKGEEIAMKALEAIMESKRLKDE